jgi:hypothetical protein
MVGPVKRAILRTILTILAIAAGVVFVAEAPLDQPMSWGREASK